MHDENSTDDSVGTQVVVKSTVWQLAFAHETKTRRQINVAYMLLIFWYPHTTDRIRDQSLPARKHIAARLREEWTICTTFLNEPVVTLKPCYFG